MLFVKIPVKEGLILRLLRLSDAQNLFNLIDENRDRLEKNLLWVEKHTTVEHTFKFIYQVLDNFWTQKNGVTYGIWQDDRLIGTIAFRDWDQNESSASIGYWISRESEGQGIMKACTKALMDYLFCIVGIYRIWIQCCVENERSNRIPASIGMEKAKVIENAVVLHGEKCSANIYDMVVGEWKRRRQKLMSLSKSKPRPARARSFFIIYILRYVTVSCRTVANDTHAR